MASFLCREMPLIIMRCMTLKSPAGLKFDKKTHNFTSTIENINNYGTTK
jgi:hypothetical protein